MVKCGATINTVVNLCHIFPGPRRLGIVVDTTPGIGQQSRDPESRHIDSEGEALLNTHHSLRCIVPPGLLDRVARAGDEAARNAALDTLALDRRFRLSRAESVARTGGFLARPVTFARAGGEPNRTIYDQQHSESQTPGTAARSEGQPPVSDSAVNQAYDGLGATYDYYWSVFQRDSLDGQGLSLLGCVHFGSNYDNAFYDGAGHMFFGDGDGQLLTQTTAGIDVIGHELTHGVTQHEANLTYSGQSGALNESISDVFGIQVKQRVLGQDVTQSDWLIGADIVGPVLQPALRSMKAPGTANSPQTWTTTCRAGTCTRTRAFPTARSPSSPPPWAATPGMPPGRFGMPPSATRRCTRALRSPSSPG